MRNQQTVAATSFNANLNVLAELLQAGIMLPNGTINPAVFSQPIAQAAPTKVAPIAIAKTGPITVMGHGTQFKDKIDPETGNVTPGNVGWRVDGTAVINGQTMRVIGAIVAHKSSEFAAPDDQHFDLGGVKMRDRTNGPGYVLQGRITTDDGYPCAVKVTAFPKGPKAEWGMKQRTPTGVTLTAATPKVGGFKKAAKITTKPATKKAAKRR